MTVSTTARQQTFAGTQSTLTFTFRASTARPEDIKVINREISTGYETPLTYTTDYTVSVDSDGVGGTVTLVATYASTVLHIVRRVTTLTQESDYQDYSRFPSDTLEENLDQLTMISQEQDADEDLTSNKIKAWATFNGTGTNPITPTAVYGVSNSVTKLGTGSYIVFLSPTFSSTSYAVLLSGGGTTNFALAKITDGTSTSTTCISVSTLNTSFAAVDVKYISVAVLSN